MAMLATELHEIDQQITRWIRESGMPIEELLRLLLAACIGGLVGLEREMRGRQAGFRTNILVCVGSALVMLVSISLADVSWSPNGWHQITVDPGRIAYGVMTGIGFLGAGTIIQQRGSVRGLTTAAGLWCVAAAGLAAGLGLYVLCIAAAILIVTALWVLDYVEGSLPRVRYRTVTIRVPWRQGCIVETIDYFKRHDLDVEDVDFERTSDLSQVDVSLRVAFTNKRQYYNLERDLEGRQDWQLMATRQP
jgi:putative Mg2+ transporter-C (MgtC) family protein